MGEVLQAHLRDRERGNALLEQLFHTVCYCNVSTPLPISKRVKNLGGLRLRQCRLLFSSFVWMRSDQMSEAFVFCMPKNSLGIFLNYC